MFTKNEIIQIAKTRFAEDYNCRLSDFEKQYNTATENKYADGSRGPFFKVVCFRGKVIISASPEILPWCEEKLVKRAPAWFFEYPKLRAMDEKLKEYGQEIADIHQYYLPDPAAMSAESDIKVKWYEAEDIMQFKDDDRFDEAFAFDDNCPDMLAVAAIDGDKIMGMAGASADSKTMWQIGINVMPEYCSRGIGTKLVALLTAEILKRGKVPYYGTCQSHFSSQNIAINAGYFPAWIELYSGVNKEK